MLHISSRTIHEQIAPGRFQSFQQTALSNSHRSFIRWLVATLFLLLGALFLPWTQNIQSKGKVAVLSPQHRPQTIHSILPGRIEQWFVRDGQFVQAGDTIAFISEIKSEYFDPALVARSRDQLKAKSASIDAYEDKMNALRQQTEAYQLELEVKTKQLQNKIRQTELKVVSDSIEATRSRLDYQIAERQWKRADTLYQQGIKPLNEVEDKRLKLQETSAKMIAAENKLLSSRNDLQIAQLELRTATYETRQKIAKSNSDLFGAATDQLSALADTRKLEIQTDNYQLRADSRYVLAPQSGYIAKILQTGIGETIKEGEALVSILPADFEPAVEMYVRPMDFPLLHTGTTVRFIFDGWPAFVFSGWPGASFGAYQGRIVAIDNIISDNGQYRVLVAPDPADKPWPKALRPGSGANAITLLNTVPVWYEMWRQLNGFPPDYYDSYTDAPKGFKWDAPIKSLK